MSSINQIFIRQLQHYIKKNHISINELSHITKVSRTTILNWINGNSSPTLSKIDDICNSLKISPLYLLTDKDTQLSAYFRILKGKPRLYFYADNKLIGKNIKFFYNNQQLDKSINHSLNEILIIFLKLLITSKK